MVDGVSLLASRPLAPYVVRSDGKQGEGIGEEQLRPSLRWENRVRPNGRQLYREPG
jgi:hypothetical protein